ncbi:putative GTPase activating protein for arf domain-containing protein [Hirsutella rhossiliensis]|uniref:GTPase activating protein for arf domain-containing protein n=1 Tax=Hirsutella rhossiliensis TaxID=111463 RepID=A0A9P8SE91_9HYPO|nr:putative GTPase activating protein for arf domain-containing protein [Hirsutella rhossiliensis]KAH0959431.1 putative GTPase activating protein for arf domain-containing protein [Hirsutella rhossiliensis]
MTSALSKRQLARNEKLLQDLVQSVPGNNRCADCHIPNPAWASWSLGVFLCMRCATIHRKLGTHISKVKSLSMDSWSNEQLDNMRKVGNVVSNQVYNPGNRKPPVPVDADEADSAMERFIRHKYVNNVPNDIGKPRSPRSDEGTPPPLPPKNSTKFGFRSASSIFPLSSRAKREAKMAAVMGARSSTPPGLTNKPSKVFGATVDFDGPDEADKKLARLRDMGFLDDQRNAIVLKGVNGSVDRAVEALVRLGEGGLPGAITSPREHALRTSKSLTPLSKPAGSPVGLSVPQNGAQERPTTASTSSSNNPFDMMAMAQPQTAQSTGSLQHKNPYNSSWADLSTNPFGRPSHQQTDAVSQAFQGLTVSAPQQSLFPHRTGDYMSPSAPTSPYYHHQPMNFQSAMTYPQPQPASYNNNPFLTQSSSPAQALGPQQNLSIPEQGQSNFVTASPQPLPTNSNPFFVNSLQIPPQQMSQQSAGQAAWDPQSAFNQQQPQYQPQRQDKASIMALYNRPYQAPQQPMAPGSSLLEQTPSASENQAAYSALPARPQAASTTGQPRSVSQPLPGSTNPFLTSGATAATSGPLSSSRHINRDSMNLDMAWTNGRHSPDAFASLSARHV